MARGGAGARLSVEVAARLETGSLLPQTSQMGKTASVTCAKCGAENEVLLSQGTFEDHLRQASFSFACRVCGTKLPDEENDDPGEPSIR